MMRRVSQLKRKNSRGFTLLDVLTVIGIVGILAAIAIPQFASYQGRGFNARVEADARSAALAQETYFADHDTYTSGDCRDLPTMRLSHGVACTTSGDASAFTVETSHPNATKRCIWRSSPEVGQPTLVCS